MALTLYLYSAWALALLFSAVVGAWTGGTVAMALLVSALFAGTLYLRATRAGAGTDDETLARPDGADGNAARDAAELCEAVAAPAAVVQDGAVSQANRAFLALLEFGGRRGELLGQPAGRLVHPLDQGRFAGLMAAVAQGQRECPPERLRMLRADGDSIRMQVCAAPLGTVSGAVLLQLGPDAQAPARPGSADISSAMLAQLDLVVVSVDAAGEMTYVNRAWERLAGDPQVDVRGRQFRAYLHAADRDAVRAEFATILHGRQQQATREVRLIGADGSVHWMDLRAHPCVLADGEVIGVLATLFEITPRKRGEGAAAGGRRLPATLLANLPGMVYRSRNDDQWTMDFVSDGSLELTGFEPYELVKNARASWGSLIHPDDREFVRQQVQASVSQRKPFRMTYRIVDALGKESWVWEQGQGVFSSSGELLALEGFITDVRMRIGAEEKTLQRLDVHLDAAPDDRARFERRVEFLLQHAAAAGYPCALLWIDIDDFEATCGRIGPRGADQVLAMLADRLDVLQGPGASLNWLGSGQFAMVLTDFRVGGAPCAVPAVTEIMPACSEIAGRLARAIGSPLALEGAQLPLTASIGIATSQAGYDSGDAMIAAARRAAEEARERMGPGHCEFADE